MASAPPSKRTIHTMLIATVTATLTSVTARKRCGRPSTR
jgi:hypothetical protein